MKNYFETSKTSSLKNKLILLVGVAVLPFLVMSVYLLISLNGYSKAYDNIVSNMMIANNYNLDFRDELDESIYRLVAGSITLENIDDDDSVKDPYELVQKLRTDFSALVKITTDRESRLWLQSLLRNLDTLEDRIDDIKYNLDEGGHYDENMEMLDNNIYILTELIQDDIQYYIYYQTRSMNSLKLQLNAQVEQFLLVFGVMLAVILLLVVLIAAQIMSGIVRPIERLRKVTGAVAHGDFGARAETNGPMEIAELSGSVNDMTVHLEAMVKKIKEDESKMRHAELRLLQEQINPHFLYNTLDTIVWLIESDSTDEAVDMVVSLSQFFRLVLSHGAEYISIREEEQHIRSYLKIQQARYHDILDYEINIAPDIYPYKILKLTLQPLVENALYHGIKYKRAMGKITITGMMQDRKIVLTVQDNGVGMEPEKLAHLRREIERPCKDTEGGFGLANVNERIRMYFGDYYGMQIDSVQGVGTTVTVTIPALYIPPKDDQIQQGGK
ncbi:MAG: sensor histidine kinase [Lachnospiraceae bacterium]|nr:sensor histidine kinase [Lachnospiraceae bacterium]